MLRAVVGAVKRCSSHPCLPVGEPVLTYSPKAIRTVDGMTPWASRTCAIAAFAKPAASGSVAVFPHHRVANAD